MGVFDTYKVACPHCFSLIEEQMKPGNMNTYVFGDNPRTDIKFVGSYFCYECNGSFRIELESLPKVVIVKE